MTQFHLLYLLVQGSCASTPREKHRQVQPTHVSLPSALNNCLHQVARTCDEMYRDGRTESIFSVKSVSCPEVPPMICAHLMANNSLIPRPSVQYMPLTLLLQCVRHTEGLGTRLGKYTCMYMLASFPGSPGTRICITGRAWYLFYVSMM